MQPPAETTVDTDVDPPPRVLRRRFPPALLPLLVLVTVVVVWLLHAGLGTALALALFAILLPVCRDAAERVVTAALAFAALVGVLFVVLPVPVTRTTSTVLVLALPALSATASVLRARSGTVRERLPRAGVADLAVLLVGVASAWWTLAASYGMDLRDTLTRLFHGWDWILHMTMYTDVYRYGRLAGLHIDDSSAYLSANPQLHPALWAATTWSSQDGSATMPGDELLQAGVLATALTSAVCLAALAWLASDVATAIVGTTRHRVPSVVATVVTGAVLIVGVGSAVFFFGHTPFLVAVVALTVGSYLAVRPSLRGRPTHAPRALVLLLATTVVVVLEWPPLVLGLVVPGLLLAVRIARGHRRTTIALAIGGALVLVLLPMWWPRVAGAVTFRDLADATGETAQFSLPLAAVAIAVCLVVAVGFAMRDDWGRTAGLLGPVLGMLAFSALLMANGATWWSEPPSYYLLKTLLGCLVATTPVVVAAIVAGLSLLPALRRRHGDRSRAPAAPRLWPSLAGLALLALAVATILSPSGSVAPGAPVALADPARFVTYADTIARAYPVTPAVDSQAPFLADYGDERANLWLLVLQRGISDADHDFYRTLPAFYPPQTGETAESLVPPPDDWAAVICAQLRVRPDASFVAMTDHPDEVRAWVRSPTTRATRRGSASCRSPPPDAGLRSDDLAGHGDAAVGRRGHLTLVPRGVRRGASEHARQQPGRHDRVVGETGDGEQRLGEEVDRRDDVQGRHEHEQQLAAAHPVIAAEQHVAHQTRERREAPGETDGALLRGGGSGRGGESGTARCGRHVVLLGTPGRVLIVRTDARHRKVPSRGSAQTPTSRDRRRHVSHDRPEAGRDWHRIGCAGRYRAG